ncbi:hypothetical protein RI129_004307 [Pyrocoelia pectoralis]|uniref:Multidrug resistance-associated protein lethal(2)03659 n=1 Tax=Pyrocoelia pectoralis TaxID=417401 RepID=A0AAN7VIK9_9COLE
MDEPSEKRSKHTNPRERANIFSILTFFYTLPTYCANRKRDLTKDDLYETFSGHKSSKLGSKAKLLWEQELENAKLLKRTPSILKVLIRLFGWEYLLIGIALGIEHVILNPAKAVLLGELIHYSAREIKKDPPYVYALSIIGLSLISCTIIQPSFMASSHLGLKIRVACSCLVYNKIFRLNSAALNLATPGHIINLLSTDLNVFESVGFLFHFIWIAPVQTILVIYLMWSEIGVSSLFGLGCIAICVLGYVRLGGVIVKFRSKLSARRDDRIRLTNQLIQGIGVIKMYAWENTCAEAVLHFRNAEINTLRKLLYIKGLFTFAETIVTISIFLTITSSVLLNSSFDSKAIFVIITLFSSTGVCWITFFLNTVAVFSETRVALQRFLNFLLSEEIDFGGKAKHEIVCAISIKNGHAKWNNDLNQEALTNVNLVIREGSLTALIGPVGCGKTTLCNVIQGELQLSDGNLCVNGSLSCASQEPWIFAASIRQNILFGSKMDETRYEKVIKCCALETDLAQFPHGDRTIVGERGSSLSGGQKARINLARCVYREANIYLLDNPLSAVDTRVGKHIFENCIQTFLKGKTVVLVTHQLQYLAHVDNVIALSKGVVKLQGSGKELKSSNLDLLKYVNEHGTPNSECSTSSRRNEVNTSKNVEISTTADNITLSTYKQYLFSSKSYLLVFSTMLLFIAAELATSGSLYFIAHWVNVEQRRPLTYQPIEENLYVYVYCSIAMAAVILTILRLLTFTNLLMKSSTSLHNSLLANLLRATLNFFTINSDFLSVDELLPHTSLITIVSILNVIGLLAVICTANVLFVIPTILLLIILYCGRRFYLSTNLNVLRIESVARSPFYSYVQSTLQGLPTIRTFEVQKKLVKEFNHHLDTHKFNNYLDTHSTALHMSYSVSRAFGYWIDLLSFIFVSTTIIFYMFTEETYGGNVGLVITQAMHLIGLLAWGMRHLTEVENCMVSVERVLEYSTIKGERDLESMPNLKPCSTWPPLGGIKFENVHLKYSSIEPFVLKNVNFTVEPLQKIGIVGRTGAGKSSIIAALFQLTETEGSIVIDGVDITTIGLHELRKKMSIIPQDPVLFSGTIRSNLDPFEEFDDQTLWSALDDCQSTFSEFNLSRYSFVGLSSLVSHDGSNLSVGQRQLLCLARAIVRRNRILILDEATANVDLETDEIIQETIRTKFGDCTVLTVAHRINTIIDSDKILVMSAGELVEFDHPYVLLQRKDGIFYNMVQQMDVSMAESLVDTARQVSGI